MWKGAITFGLVNVPVKLYSATEDHDISLHQVHDRDNGRIRYQRRCEVCGKVVEFEHIDKAYEEGDKTIVLTEKDLSSLPEERSREIEVVEFVPSDQLDPIMFDRSYFLEPDSSSAKAYVLLRQTLEQTDHTAIVHFALRQKTRLGALRVHGDVLMLQALLWDDEVREADFPALKEKVRISAKELEMSAALVDSFAADFAPDKFHDDYQEQLRTLIEAKLKEGDAVDTERTFGKEPAEADGGEVLDLMEALRKSVERNRLKAGSAAAGEGKTSGRAAKTRGGTAGQPKAEARAAGSPRTRTAAAGRRKTKREPDASEKSA